MPENYRRQATMSLWLRGDVLDNFDIVTGVRHMHYAHAFHLRRAVKNLAMSIGLYSVC